MSRLTRRLFAINDELTRLDEEERLTREELFVLRHLDDDARRDAAVSDSPLDRADARDTGGDVARFERALDHLQQRRRALHDKRDRLLRRLG